MGTKEIIRILKEVPETHLRILDIAWKVTGEDGTVDPQKVAFYAEELEEATKEAERYSKETKEAVRCLRELLHS